MLVCTTLPSAVKAPERLVAKQATAIRGENQMRQISNFHHEYIVHRAHVYSALKLGQKFPRVPVI